MNCDKLYSFDLSFGDEVMEVMGNIHENPELLKP